MLTQCSANSILTSDCALSASVIGYPTNPITRPNLSVAFLSKTYHRDCSKMAQPHSYTHFGSAPNGGSIDPNDLSMAGSYAQGGFSNNNSNDNFNNHTNSGNGSNAFATGSALIADEDLLDGLGHDGLQNNGQDFSGINMGFSQDAYQAHRHSSGLRLDPSQVNGYSSTPDGDPIPSPYTTGFHASFRQMQNNPSLSTSLHSPMPYSGSPMTAGDMGQDGNDQAYLNARARARMSQQMQRKPSNTRTPMTPKTNAAMHNLSIGSQESQNFGPQSIRTVGSHDKSPSGQWGHNHTPTGSFPASFNSGFSSPMQAAMVPPIDEVMIKGGTSMPAKLGVNSGNALSSQEAKRKRRRESHNLVERRRRDNINERIQDLSKLVPTHRLEDDKIRKLIQNGTPLSPTLTGISSPSQATSGLAGPGARRAAGTSAGNITTGLPIDDKDKGPNKGDILNGAVSWTRDLMWMLHLKLQQQEELMNHIGELGGHFPFEMTDDERRMQSELIDAMTKSEPGAFSYSRTSGSGLRVPHHTDYRGTSASDVSGNLDSLGITPPENGGSAMGRDLGDTNQFWHDPDDDGHGNIPLSFKEDDEYDMDLTH